MFDLQEFLLRGFEPGAGNVRQSITEVDEAGEREGLALQHQTASEFHSQGSGMSSQGLSQLSQHSEGGKSSVAELNVSLNSNANNNNSNSVSVFDSSGGSLVCTGRGRSESMMSMDEILNEFDIGGASLALSQPAGSGLRHDSETRPQLILTSNDSTTPTPSSVRLSSSSLSQPPPLHLPTRITSHSSHQHLEDEEENSRGLMVHHQRQHSRSFNSGLNQLVVAEDPRRRSKTLSLAKSISSDTLNKKGSGSNLGKKKKGKGKDKVTKTSVGSKKKHHTGSVEALSQRDVSQKPPVGRPRRTKLVLEPRGPLFGVEGGGSELRRHSALMVETHSSHLSQLTHVDYQEAGETPEGDHHDMGETPEVKEGSEREEGREESVLSLQPAAGDGESLSLADFFHGQIAPSPPPGAEDDSVWQEYGQF